MALGGQNIKATRRFHGLLIDGMLSLDPRADFLGVSLGISGDGFHDFEIDIAAQFDVGTTARHIGRDCHSTQLACIGNDLRFLLVLARVQNVVLDILFRQQLAEHFGFFDRGGADQNGLALGRRLTDRFNDGRVFFFRRAIDMIVIVNPRDRAVCWHFHNAKPIDRHEFFGLGRGRTRHAAELVIQAEIILEGDRSHCDVLGLDLAAFLGFNRLVQTIRHPPPGHHTARKFINQHHFVIANNIVLVLLIDLMGPQSIGGVMHDCG